jgi:hypothetical protein
MENGKWKSEKKEKGINRTIKMTIKIKIKKTQNKTATAKYTLS